MPPPGEGWAPAAGTNLTPLGDRQALAVDERPYAPWGEDRALAAGDNHVPSENRQAPAMGGRPFLSRTQILRLLWERAGHRPRVPTTLL